MAVRAKKSETSRTLKPNDLAVGTSLQKILGALPSLAIPVRPLATDVATSLNFFWPTSVEDRNVFPELDDDQDSHSLH